MALDSREKRQNVPGIARPWMRSHDTATIDEQWRIGVGLAYGGTALSPATSTVAPKFFHHKHHNLAS